MDAIDQETCGRILWGPFANRVTDEEDEGFIGKDQVFCRQDKWRLGYKNRGNGREIEANRRSNQFPWRAGSWIITCPG